MKTTNPSLIRRYFKNELKPGDHSKDFKVNDEYHLMFIGHVPYSREERHDLVASKHPDGGFIFWFGHKKYHPAYELTKGKLPDGIHYVAKSNTALSRSYMFLIQAVTGTQSHVDTFLPLFNQSLDELDDLDQLWKRVESNSSNFGVLWGKKKTDLDFSELSEKLAPYLMQKRMGG